jgi:hypothetical protein
MSTRIHTAMVGQRSGQGADAGCATHECDTVGYRWLFARRLIGRCCDTHQRGGSHFGVIHAISGKPPPPGTRPDRHTTMTCLTPAKRSLPDWSPHGPESCEPFAACQRMAMRRAERSIMSEKSQVLLPDARGNMRDLRKHAERKGAGARVGTWSRYVEKKRTHPAPSREKVLHCCRANRGVTTPPSPSSERCHTHLCTLAGTREEIRPPSPPTAVPSHGSGAGVCVTLCRMLSP